MIKVNSNFGKLQGSYLFSETAKRINAHAQAHPEVEIIRLGIGDVTMPICEAVSKAMHKAVDEMATKGGFHGYGPEQGYEFLRAAIAKNDYKARGVDIG